MCDVRFARHIGRSVENNYRIYTHCGLACSSVHLHLHTVATVVWFFARFGAEFYYSLCEIKRLRNMHTHTHTAHYTRDQYIAVTFWHGHSLAFPCATSWQTRAARLKRMKHKTGATEFDCAIFPCARSAQHICGNVCACERCPFRLIHSPLISASELNKRKFAPTKNRHTLWYVKQIRRECDDNDLAMATINVVGTFPAVMASDACALAGRIRECCVQALRICAIFTPIRIVQFHENTQFTEAACENLFLANITFAS